MKHRYLLVVLLVLHPGCATTNRSFERSRQKQAAAICANRDERKIRQPLNTSFVRDPPVVATHMRLLSIYDLSYDECVTFLAEDHGKRIFSDAITNSADIPFLRLASLVSDALRSRGKSIAFAGVLNDEMLINTSPEARGNANVYYQARAKRVRCGTGESASVDACGFFFSATKVSLYGDPPNQKRLTEVDDDLEAQILEFVVALLR